MLDVLKRKIELEVKKLVVGGFDVPGYHVSTSRLRAMGYFIPASSLKGRIRQILELTYGVGSWRKFFDNSMILFSDLKAEEVHEVENVHARINRLTSRAEDPRSVLAVSGKFSGELRIIADENIPKEEYKRFFEELKKAFELLKLYGLGRFTNVGYGRVENRKINGCESVLGRCDCEFDCSDSSRNQGSQGNGSGHVVHLLEPKSAILFYSYLPTSSTLYRAACRLYYNAGIKVPKAIGGPYLWKNGKLYALGGPRLAALGKEVGLEESDPVYYTRDASNNITLDRPIGKRIMPRLIVDRITLRSTGPKRIAYNSVYVLKEKGRKIAIVTDDDDYSEFFKLISALGIGRYKSLQSGYEYDSKRNVSFDDSSVIGDYTYTLNDYPHSVADKVVGRLHEYPLKGEIYTYIHGGLIDSSAQNASLDERPEVTKADGKCGLNVEKLPIGFPIVKRSARAPVIIFFSPVEAHHLGRNEEGGSSNSSILRLCLTRESFRSKLNFSGSYRCSSRAT